MIADTPQRLATPVDGPLSLLQVRLDGRRDTRLLVTRTVRGHVHVTLGDVGREAVVILHPHLARRLAAAVADVLGGEELAR